MRRVLVAMTGAVVTLSACGGADTGVSTAVDSTDLDCPGETQVISGDIDEAAVGAKDAAMEVTTALERMMAHVEFAEVEPINETADGATWKAVDDAGAAVAHVAVVRQNDSFVASSLTGCSG